MINVATLGPKGTFSGLAVKKYLELTATDGKTIYYPTIGKVFNGINTECSLGIIPIENSLDGYVQQTLDLLSQNDFTIISEIVVPVQFCFLGNGKNLKDINKIYVQFKSKGQCYNFIEKFNDDVKIIITESNTESFNEVSKMKDGEGAIVPVHLLDNRFKLIVNNVTDSEFNETRFIVLSKNSNNLNGTEKYKTSIAIMNAVDTKPGVLSKILNEFAKKDINLTSIISRPTKKALGQYYFFIDIEGDLNKDNKIKEVINEISKENIIKILGSYPIIG
ncbi:MAG: ACT domain-containing protein [Clostridiales bacterium]|nr:ACT domain-containing protein [Clostridiales bacterium]